MVDIHTFWLESSIFPEYYISKENFLLSICGWVDS